MIDKEKEELLLKCLQGKAEKTEYEKAYAWIYADKSNFEYYKSARDAWIAAGIIRSYDEYDYCRAWNRVAGKIRRNNWFDPGRQGIFSGWKQIAAFFIVALISGLLTYHVFLPEREAEEYVVKAPRGSRSYLDLPDDSKVWLNAGSTLRYSTDYSVSDRLVSLEGEAFFNVNTDDEFSFDVRAYNLVFKAVHENETLFNIKAYPNENIIEATVLSGLVMLERETPAGDIKQIVIEPDQRVTMVYDDSIRTEEPEEERIEREPFKEVEYLYYEDDINPGIYTSWKDDRFIFHEKKLRDIILRLERRYNVEFIIEDEALLEYRLTDTLEQVTIEQLLRAIRPSVPMDFEVKDREVFLWSDQINKQYDNKFY